MTDNHYTDGDLRTLIAFSAAQTLSVTTNNPLDLLIPLFEPIASALHGRHFTPEELANELNSRYDLSVSEELCSYWATQLVSKGLLRPIASSDSSGGFEWCQSKLPNTPAGSFQSALEEIISAFRSFLETEPDLFTSTKTDSELVEILRHGAITSLFPKMSSGNGQALADDEYVFGRFVQSVSTSQPAIFDSIVKLRQAAIYCDLIAHLQSPRGKPTNSQYVAAYLDSPLAMDLLGMGGSRRQQFTVRLLNKMKDLGLLPTINVGMIDELRINVRAFLARPPSARYGSTADAMRRGELTPQALSAMSDRAEILLLDAGVEVDKFFDNHVNRSELTGDVEDQLFSKLQSNYRRIPAVERDIRAIKGVYGRRGPNIPRDIYTSTAFFLTSNEMLSAVANKFFRDRLNYRPSSFPVVLTRAKAAAIIDAIFGIPSSESLTMSELLVSAAEATEYSPDVLKAIEDQLNRLSPEEANGLVPILARTDFSQLVMDVTRGSANNVTATTISKIVQNVKSHIEIEAERAANDRVKATQSKLEQDISRRDQAISSQSSVFEAYLSGEGRRFETASAAIMKAFAEKKRNLQMMKIGLWAATIALALVAGAVAYAGTYYSDFLAKNELARLALSVVAGGIAMGSLMGFPIRTKIISAFEKKFSKSLAERTASYGYALDVSLEADDQDMASSLRRQFDANQEYARLRMKLGSRVPLEAQKLL